MNKTSRFFLFVALTVVAFNCKKYDEQYFFTPEEIKWMAYDTVLHPANFIDQNGQQYQATLLQRRFFHAQLSTGKNASYSADAIAEILIDTIHASIKMNKQKRRGQGELFVCDFNAADLARSYYGDYGNTIAEDSVLIGATWHKTVFTYTADTTDANFNSQCWRFRYNKERGFLALDFRGGRYYRIQ